MDWYVIAYLEPRFLFPTEIELTTQCHDIVLFSVKLKKKFVIELMVPFEESFVRLHQRKLEKYENLQEQCVRNG